MKMMSIRKIATVAAAVALALVVVWYGALWRPQTHALGVAHQAQAAAAQQVGQLNSQVAQLQVTARQIPADTKRLQVLDAALPQSPSLDSALAQLHQAATVTGVTLASVGPSTPAAASGATGASATSASAAGPAITLTMSASGSYGQLTSFLTQLTSMPRTVVVDQVQLAGTKLITASITARMFYAGSPTP
jgi:Tfp pilus assembly protein PilO